MWNGGGEEVLEGQGVGEKGTLTSMMTFSLTLYLFLVVYTSDRLILHLDCP